MLPAIQLFWQDFDVLLLLKIYINFGEILIYLKEYGSSLILKRIYFCKNEQYLNCYVSGNLISQVYYLHI